MPRRDRRDVQDGYEEQEIKIEQLRPRKAPPQKGSILNEQYIRDQENGVYQAEPEEYYDEREYSEEYDENAEGYDEEYYSQDEEYDEEYQEEEYAKEYDDIPTTRIGRITQKMANSKINQNSYKIYDLDNKKKMMIVGGVILVGLILVVGALFLF